MYHYRYCGMHCSRGAFCNQTAAARVMLTAAATQQVQQTTASLEAKLMNTALFCQLCLSESACVLAASS